MTPPHPLRRLLPGAPLFLTPHLFLLLISSSFSFPISNDFHRTINSTMIAEATHRLRRLTFGRRRRTTSLSPFSSSSSFSSSSFSSSPSSHKPNLNHLTAAAASPTSPPPPYIWSQTTDDVTLSFLVGNDVTKKDVDFSLAGAKIEIKLKDGKTLLR